MYDYGARNYDPALGRWMNIDPKADKYYNISPYAYVADNPILYIDQNGEEIIVSNKKDQAKVLKMINSKAVGTFKFDKSGKLYLANAKGDTSKYSSYYTKQLFAGIKDDNKIEIQISATVTEPIMAKDGKTIVKDVGPVDNIDKNDGGGATWGLKNTDQLVVISGNENKDLKDTSGKALKDDASDILVHELVGHAIPKALGKKDTGNAVNNENKVRKETGSPERAPEPKHVE